MVRKVGAMAITVLLCGCGLSLTTTTDAPGLTPVVLPSGPGDVSAPGLEQMLSVESTSKNIDDIVMIGDSITVGSTPALEAAFARIGYDDVLIVAENGKRLDRSVSGNPSGASVAEFLTSEPADRSNELWVIALGTNDINQYREDDLRAAVAELLDAVPAESPIVWVDTYFGAHPDATALVNATIVDMLAERGNATISRWSAVAGGEGVLRSDGVHPREVGSELFADTVVDTVTRFIDA